MTIEIDVSMTGTEEIIKSVETIEKKLKSKDIKEYLAKKMINVVNEETKDKLEYFNSYINHNKYYIDNDSITIYNDVQNEDGQYYSLVIEYGSGTYKEGEDFSHTATYDNTGGLYWLVPVNKTNNNLENYNYQIITITLEDGTKEDFYKVYGQTAKHIYRESSIRIEREINQWIIDYLNEVV